MWGKLWRLPASCISLHPSRKSLSGPGSPIFMRIMACVSAAERGGHEMKSTCPEGRLSRNQLFDKGGDLFNKHQRGKSCWGLLKLSQPQGLKGRRPRTWMSPWTELLATTCTPSLWDSKQNTKLREGSRRVWGQSCNLYGRWHCFTGLCVTYCLLLNPWHTSGNRHSGDRLFYITNAEGV